MKCWKLAFLIVLLHPKCLRSLKLSRVAVSPSPMIMGQGAKLICNYDLEGTDLYSLKWYKNGREFYRFMPSQDEKRTIYTVAGVNIDLQYSGMKELYISSVSLETAGDYRCEVSVEVDFDTVSNFVRADVIALPQGPHIEGLPGSYSLGDHVRANCTAANALPTPTLTWYINKVPVMTERPNKRTSSISNHWGSANDLDQSARSQLIQIPSVEHAGSRNSNSKSNNSIAYSMTNNNIRHRGQQQSNVDLTSGQHLLYPGSTASAGGPQGHDQQHGHYMGHHHRSAHNAHHHHHQPLVTSVLTLSFQLHASHFQNGEVQLKCTIIQGNYFIRSEEVSILESDLSYPPDNRYSRLGGSALGGINTSGQGAGSYPGVTPRRHGGYPGYPGPVTAGPVVKDSRTGLSSIANFIGISRAAPVLISRGFLVYGLFFSLLCVLMM